MANVLSIYNYSVICPTAGLRYCIVPVKILTSDILFSCPRTNTGVVYIGDSEVMTDTGTILNPGESINFETSPLVGDTINELLDMQKFYIISEVANEGVRIIYYAHKDWNEI